MNKQISLYVVLSIPRTVDKLLSEVPQGPIGGISKKKKKKDQAATSETPAPPSSGASSSRDGTTATSSVVKQSMLARGLARAEQLRKSEVNSSSDESQHKTTSVEDMIQGVPLDRVPDDAEPTYEVTSTETGKMFRGGGWNRPRRYNTSSKGAGGASGGAASSDKKDGKSAAEKEPEIETLLDLGRKIRAKEREVSDKVKKYSNLVDIRACGPLPEPGKLTPDDIDCLVEQLPMEHMSLLEKKERRSHFNASDSDEDVGWAKPKLGNVKEYGRMASELFSQILDSEISDQEGGPIVVPSRKEYCSSSSSSDERLTESSSCTRNSLNPSSSDESVSSVRLSRLALLKKNQKNRPNVEL